MTRRDLLQKSAAVLGAAGTSGLFGFGSTGLSAMAKAESSALEVSALKDWKEKLLRAFEQAQKGEDGVRAWEASIANSVKSASNKEIELWMECQFLHDLPFAEFKATRGIRLSPMAIETRFEANILKPRLMVVPKGMSNVPHAHNQMVSAHIVLKGEAQLSAFSRDYQFEIADKSLGLRLVETKVVRPGDVVCMTPYSANVHWFAAKQDFVTLCLPLGDLVAPAPSKPTVEFSDHLLIYVDPTEALRTDRRVNAPIISEKASNELFLNRSLKYFA
jgi:hypothetical protein